MVSRPVKPVSVVSATRRVSSVRSATAVVKIPWSVETVPSAITCGARATVTLSRVSGTGLAYGLLA